MRPKFGVEGAGPLVRGPRLGNRPPTLAKGEDESDPRSRLAREESASFRVSSSRPNAATGETLRRIRPRTSGHTPRRRRPFSSGYVRWTLGDRGRTEIGLRPRTSNFSATCPRGLLRPPRPPPPDKTPSAGTDDADRSEADGGLAPLARQPSPILLHPPRRNPLSLSILFVSTHRRFDEKSMSPRSSEICGKFFFFFFGQ